MFYISQHLRFGGVLETSPGNAAHNFGMLSINYGLLWGRVACFLGYLAFQAVPSGPIVHATPEEPSGRSIKREGLNHPPGKPVAHNNTQVPFKGLL